LFKNIAFFLFFFGRAAAPLRGLRRAIRSITFAGFISFTRFGGSATIPLAAASPPNMKYEINMNAEGIREAQYFVLDTSILTYQRRAKRAARGIAAEPPAWREAQAGDGADSPTRTK